MNREKAGLAIERLLRFGEQRGLIGALDVIPVRNVLLDLFGLVEPYSGSVPAEQLDSPVEPLLELLDAAVGTPLLPDDTTTYRDLLDARIMGLLMPRQSEVAARFWHTAKSRGAGAATDDFYRLSIDSHYIMMDRVRRNQYWLASTAYGDLEITVNLSKPEKDPKEIALLKNVQSSRYPKCLLCLENVGYAGRLNHPARQNHRVIPLELDGDTWYLQYSPYVYYNEHCIVFCERHVPMRTTPETFRRLLDFAGQFPHYFVGSNADLPIVGGSILDHDHFQGGRHVFPMEKAPVETVLSHPDYPGVKAGIVKWPMSVLRLSSHDKDSLLRLATAVLEAWKGYSDAEAEVLAYSPAAGESGAAASGGVPHNTITPIARHNAQGELELDLVLRNNRTSEEHPDGIFHPHRELHHIKKENIGLIEVMGLAVLPGRLKGELEAIAAILTGAVPEVAEAADALKETAASPQEGIVAGLMRDTAHPLHKHAAWVGELIARYGTKLSAAEAEAALQQEVGAKFLNVLEHAGVYKRDERGQAAFRRFAASVGLV
ncbi:galactose-1-phosphate uridylyltransferase [Gordoniibacillus kamchatkensis]|uniref:Galactose-1-phosphate uridylyltransferase n=1 Tax=Gordoniibacillus kamchatkensis TaxID=1590651 RepID=A0ABR5AFQ3_9BACL|nr:galactose-1-phosphate uridylyltransferase [Paenibacillus sp. VKM B-2647]